MLIITVLWSILVTLKDIIVTLQISLCTLLTKASHKKMEKELEEEPEKELEKKLGTFKICTMRYLALINSGIFWRDYEVFLFKVFFGLKVALSFTLYERFCLCHWLLLICI